MTMMRAVALHPSGRLVDVELPKPVPTGKDLLVQVRAVSVNPVDTKQKADEGQVRVLGWDVAGVVEETGSDCTLFRPGDEVYYAGDITRPGGFSEYQLVDERLVGHKPKSIDFAQAAVLPLTSLTAWEGLFHRLGLKVDHNEPETVLIVGAAGGVGSIATQLARRAGLTVIGTASRPESAAWVQHLGAHHVVNHFEPFLPQLEALGFASVKFIFCLNNVVDSNWDNMMDVLAPQGKLCTILPPVSPVNMRPLFDKSAAWCMEYMFTRPKYRTSDMAEHHHILMQLAEWVDAGEIRSTLNERMAPISAANLEKAFAKLRSGRTIGKIALESFE